MKIILLFIVFVIFQIVSSYDKAEKTTEFWNAVTERQLECATRVFQNLNTNKAKNIILLIGDGMSINTVTAGRIAIGQKLNLDGEGYSTSLDEMPHVGIVKTYSVDHQTPDSAATATAFLSGVKTNSGYLGVNANGGSCATVAANMVKTVLDYASEAGKSTGVVTTTRVQHATPAASYAHAHKRSFYSDKYYTTAEYNIRDKCPDISTQLFNNRKKIQVVMGGGRMHMLPLTSAGDRKDRRNLIKEWIEDMNKTYNARYVTDKFQLSKVDPDTTDYLMGLFSGGDMKYSIDKKPDHPQPSLPEMVEKAIKILSKNKNGFFLLVESGLIDKGHHECRAQRALGEFHELAKSVEITKSLTKEENTLVITTADHGHMFMLGGYSVRGNNVYGLAPSHSNPSRAKDGKYWTSILYGNGPGNAAIRNPRAERQSITSWAVTSKFYRQQSAVPLSFESHSAEDTVVFASGPMAHLLTGVNEQTHIAAVMQYAACIGPRFNKGEHCLKTTSSNIFNKIQKSVTTEEFELD